MEYLTILDCSIRVYQTIVVHVELDPDKWLKLNSCIFLKQNIISSNQEISNYSNEVKNTHVQFGDPTSLGKTYKQHMCTLWLLHKQCMGKTFDDNNLTIKHFFGTFLEGKHYYKQAKFQVLV